LWNFQLKANINRLNRPNWQNWLNGLNRKMGGGKGQKTEGRLNLVFQMTFVTELPLGFTELRSHIPAIVAVHNIIATCTAIARSGVRVSNKRGVKIPSADIFKG
jgi:hypothetical protein